MSAIQYAQKVCCLNHHVFLCHMRGTIHARVHACMHACILTCAHLFMLVRMHVCDMTENLCADGGRRARRISEVQHASPREDSGGSSIFTRIPRVLQEGRCARRAVVSLFPSIDPVERGELSGTPSRSCPRWIFGCELAIDDIGRLTRDSLRTDSVSPISPSLSPYLSSYLFQTPPPPPRLPLGNQHLTRHGLTNHAVSFQRTSNRIWQENLAGLFWEKVSLTSGQDNPSNFAPCGPTRRHQ